MAREKSEQRQSRGKAQRSNANQSKIILNAEKGRSEATQSRHAKLHDERIERSATQAAGASAQLERVAPLAIVTAEPEAAHNPLLHLAALELPFGLPNPLSLTLNKGERAWRWLVIMAAGNRLYCA